MRTALVILFLLCAPQGWSRDIDSTEWRVVFETRSLGPIETVLRFHKGEGTWTARTRGASPIAIDLVRAPDGSFTGPLVSGKPGPKATLRVDGDRIEGTIDEGLLRGSFHGTPFQGALPLRNYEAVLQSLDRVMKRQVYLPSELEKPGWKTFRAAAATIAGEAQDDFEFLMGIRKAWKNDPFSHFQLQRSAAPVESMIAAFDGMRMGRETARLELDGDVAVLTVDTMMGSDTIEQIRSAYDEIAKRKPKALVIDLRENDGGAFAVVPLVQHVLREPLEAGMFIGNRWWAARTSMPTDAQLNREAPWTGWSIIAFWRDVQEKGLLRIRFEPQAPHFDGRVFVVTSAKTASAAELAADALRSSNRARIIGEPTSGEMLSGSYFDLVDGFTIFLPVADYVSRRIGRIDGKGLRPDVAVPASEALEKAIALAKE